MVSLVVVAYAAASVVAVFVALVIQIVIISYYY